MLPEEPDHTEGAFKAVDVLIGAGTVIIGRCAALGRSLTRPARLVAPVILDPPWATARHRPSRALDSLAARGRTARGQVAHEVQAVAGAVIEAVGPAVLQRILTVIDLTDIVVEEVDLDRVVESVLARLDTVALVDATLDETDLTELVRSRVDVIRIADEVIDGVDLPGIIRASTTGVAGEVVSGARAGAANADEAVARAFARLRGRRAPVAEAP